MAKKYEQKAEKCQKRRIRSFLSIKILAQNEEEKKSWFLIIKKCVEV